MRCSDFIAQLISAPVLPAKYLDTVHRNGQASANPAYAIGAGKVPYYLVATVLLNLGVDNWYILRVSRYLGILILLK